MIFLDLNNREPKSQEWIKLHKHTNSMQWVSSRDTLTGRKNNLNTSLSEVKKRFKKGHKSVTCYRVLEKNGSKNYDRR